jgi:hypothetical protein
MTEGIIIALITGGVSAIVSIIGIVAANSKHDAVIDEKIEELTREVRQHNDFARRVPVIENDIETIYKRIDRLEG